MEQIKNVIKETGKKCPTCEGQIVETFVKNFGKSNGVIGPGYHRPSWAESIGFGCSKCGLKYGEPIFKKTGPTEQIVFELNLYKAKTVRKITVDDLHPLITMVPAGKSKMDLGLGHKIEFTTMKEKSSKPKIPIELKNIKAGTEVFLVPPGEYSLELDGYKDIQLTKKKGAKTFQVKNSFIS